MGEPVQGSSELAAMAGAAFRKSNDKKAKKQQKADAAASGPRNGFRRTAGGGGAPVPKRVSKKADADGEGEGEGDDEDRAERAAAAASRKGKKSGGGGKPRNQWMYVAFLLLICGGAVQVIVPVFESLFGGGGSGSAPSAFAYPPVSHVKVDVDDVDQMRRVFFSGESWLVLCNNHTRSEPVNAVFERAAAMLHHTESAAKAHHIFTALMPCYSLLPSGKSVLERWNLARPTVETVDLDDPRLPKSTKVNRDGSANEIKHSIPTAFFVANGDKPQELARSFFGYRAKDDAITTTAHKMAELVRINSKPRNVVSVTNSGHLTNYCTKRRNCALFFYQSDDYKMPEQVRADINRICHAYRALRCVTIDVVRYKSSLAKALPPAKAGQPEWPRMVLTKKLTEDELKLLAEETAAAAAAAAAAAPAPTEEEKAAKEAEESNPSRTVNPKAKVLNSVGVLAKAHRGIWEHSAMANFIELTLGLLPSWPTADEAPIRASSGAPTADDKKMTQLFGWPTVASRPYSELPQKKAAPKKKKPSKPLTPEQKEAAAKRKAEADAAAEQRRKERAEAKAKAAANAADPAAAAAAAAADAAAEKEARERMAREEAEHLPQAADEGEESSAEPADAEAEEEEVDLDADTKI